MQIAGQLVPQHKIIRGLVSGGPGWVKHLTLVALTIKRHGGIS
jgi:hypothetical protein